ncbi:MFS transporter [Nocardioides sp. ChNu-153]|uniref:MFS transporter n=1 Tax=Nocardioides sp. ChNu-153 TaxID=2779364 RepID=UPI0026571088|nr:MFS transporter [Nocardioides sp. ChNu-153]MDN7121801.1 MFS transporter [Nocardioides sp. ChNu-153]
MSNDPAVGRLRPYVVWGLGLAVYLLAVFHRSSLAVAGLVARERFDINASQLASFVMLQLLVYAVMQVPVGVLVDRFGSRQVLLCGLVVLTCAQAGFAFAETYAVALLARVFVGVGDALVFICVLRLVSSWFPLRQVPLMSQLTGTLGQLGAVVAAVPMTLALGAFGWTRTYLGAAAVGIVLLVALLVLVHDTPTRRSLRGPALSPRDTLTGLREAWRHPGTRLGMWMHFMTPFSANALGTLWGYPFFVQGEGQDEAVAGLLLTLMVVAVMTAGPVLGWLVGAFPYHRSTMAIGIVSAMVVMWAVVLAWPGDAPLAVLVLLVVVVGVGGPASMIGFDVARTSNPLERLASATGLVNQGGFYATLLLVVGIGLVLDWRTPGDGATYTPEAFRWAMSLQFLLWGVGLVQVWRYRRSARAHLRAGEATAAVPT